MFKLTHIVVYQSNIQLAKHAALFKITTNFFLVTTVNLFTYS